MKRGNVAWFLLVLLVVLAPEVSANFACGVLNGTDNLSASWFTVEAYYSDSPSLRTDCKVSPEEFKFCCDPSEIEGETWEIGREVTAEVFDHGHVAGPVTLEISGEGYDVFPLMQLEDVVEIYQPNESVYVGGQSIPIHISTSSGYDSLSFLINYSGEIVNEEWGYDFELCTGCSEAEFLLEDLPYGNYELIFIASNDEGDEVRESWDFVLLEFLSFSREFNCERCRGNFVYSGMVVDVDLNVESSHPISGKLKDRYPNDWELVFDESLVAKEFSDTHNEVSWDVEDERVIEVSYSLLAPNVFFTHKYFFQSSFESYYGDEYGVVAYWFYKFLPYPNNYLKSISGVNYFFRFAEISPENAFVMDVEDDDLIRVVVFPTSKLEDVYAFVHKKSPVRRSGANVNFVVGTNIEEEDVDRILIQFKIEKPGFWREIEEANFFVYDVEAGSWEEFGAEMYDEDEGHGYFEVYVDNMGAYAIEPEYTW